MQKHKIILRSEWTKHGYNLTCRECEKQVLIDKLGRRRHKTNFGKKYNRNNYLGDIRKRVRV